MYRSPLLMFLAVAALGTACLASADRTAEPAGLASEPTPAGPAPTPMALPVVEGVAPRPGEPISASNAAGLTLLAVYGNDQASGISWSPDSESFYLNDRGRPDAGESARLDQVNFNGAELLPCGLSGATWAGYSPNLTLSVFSEKVSSYEPLYLRVIRLPGCEPGPTFPFGVDSGSDKTTRDVILPSLSAVAISPDDRLLAAGGATCGWVRDALRVFSLAAGDLYLSLGDDEVQRLGFSPDGSLLAAARHTKCDGYASYVDLWDMANGSRLIFLDGAVGPLAFTPDGRVLATGLPPDADTPWHATGITLWDVASGSRLRDIVLGEVVEAIAFSPDGTVLATNSPLHGQWEKGPPPGNGGLRLWDAASGDLLLHIELQNPEGVLSIPAGGVAFSPDGLYLAAGFRYDSYASTGLWGVWPPAP